MKKITRTLAVLLVLLLTGKANAQLSGNYSIPGSYSSIAAAINDLNIYGVSGPVTINIATGYTETAVSGGYTLNAILGSSSTNQITFQKSGSGANPIVYAYTGGVGTPSNAVQDGIWRFAGTDWVTVNGIDLNDPNTANPATMEFGYGFFKANAADGCHNNTIVNCVITLNRLNNVGGSNPAIDGSRGIDVVSAAVSNHTTILTVTAASGANSNNKFYSNTIQNCNYGIALIGYAASSPFTLSDTGNDIGGTSSATGNTIINYGGGGTVSASSAIRTLAQQNLNISFNTINNNNGSGVSHANTLRGIYVNTATSANVTITNNTITLNAAGTTQSNFAIDNASGSTAATNTINISNNLITNCMYPTVTSGTFYGIQSTSSPYVLSINSNSFVNNTFSSNSSSAAYYCIYNTGGVTGTINANNNLINLGTFNGAAPAHAINGIYNSGGSSACALNVNNNIFQNLTISGTAASSPSYLIYNSTTQSVATFNGNNFNNLTFNSTGAFYFMYCSTSTPNTNITNNFITTGFNKPLAGGTVYGYYNYSGGTGTALFSGNNFSNVTLTGATNFYGLQHWTGSSNLYNFNGNTISNVTTGTGTITAMYVNSGNTGSSVYNNSMFNLSGAGSIYGIFTSSGAVSMSIYSNTINALSSTGASTVYGIFQSGATTTNIFKNRIYDIQANNAGGSVYGLNISGGTTYNVYNNLIGDLRTPITAATFPLAGMYVSGATTANLYYNTVNLNATSTGSLFGSAALYASTGPALDLRNNIFVNTSVPTGTGVTVAYVRTSTTISTYAATSNNNLFYAGTPGSSNLIYSDGTNPVQTLPAFKTLMATRDGLSVTENPAFVSTAGSNANFLNINAATLTQIESGASVIAGITDDYAGTIRSPFPDIGAWEGAFTPVPVGTDVNAPVLMSSGFTSGVCSTTSRTFSVSLADLSGVGSGSLSPQLYYKIGAGTYTNVAGTLASGTASMGVWTFNLVYTAAIGDVVFYYLVAQDAAGTPNLMASPGTGFAGTSVNNVTTPPTTLNTYVVGGTLNGIYTVGAAGTFTSLTAAANAYNNACLTGSVTFSLLDASYSVNEVSPIVFQNNPGASATNSLLIIPAAANSATIATSTNTSVAAIKFLNARYITIDGVNSGGSALKILQTNTTTTGHTNFWLASSSGTGPGNNTIGLKNLGIVGTTTNACNGLIASVDGAAPSTTGGFDNDNITVSTNTFLAMFNGILAVGTASVSNGGMDNWIISNNNFGPAVTATNIIVANGISVSNVINMAITGNTIANITYTGNTVITGITVSGGTNVNILSNLVSGVSNTVATSSSYVDYGIRVLSTSGFAVSQNTVNGLYTTTHGSGVTSATGIYAGSGAINGTISANSVSRMENIDINGWGIRGVILNAGNSSSNLKVFNNFISDVVGYGDALTGVAYSPVGLEIGGSTGGVELDFNTIYLSGSHPGTAPNFNNACLSLKSGSSNLKVRNNIFANTYDNSTITTDNIYAVYSEATGLAPFAVLDNNNYYSGGTGNVPVLAYAGANLTTLSALQVSGFNANAISVFPTFNSATDLHLNTSASPNASINNGAATIAGITNDIDAQSRNATTPDIGADEFTSTAACTTADGGTLSTTAYTLCSNQTQALSPTGVSTGTGSSYQWRVSNTAGGPYTDVASGAGGSTKAYVTSTLTGGTYYYILTASCSTGPSTASSNEVTVTVNSIPDPVIVATPSIVCGSGSTTLTASGAAGYTWSTGATTSSIVITPTSSAIYNVTGTNTSCPNVTSGNFTLYLGQNPTVTATSAASVCGGVQATLTASGANTYSWSDGTSGATINPTLAAGITYTVTGFKANGCSNTTTVAVIVNPAPTLNVSGSSGLCTGQTASLTANGTAVSYSWSTGAITNTIVDTPASTTIYTVTGTDGIGCSTTVTQTVNVAASLLISIVGPSSICVGQTAILQGNGGVTYQWDGGATTETISISPTANTTYSITGASGTCSNTAVLIVTVNANPTVSIAGNATICVGNTTTLTANGTGAATYSWNTSATTSTLAVSPGTNTTYSVTAYSAEGCMATAAVAVVSNTLPVISIASTATGVCVNSNATLTASGANTYTWNMSGSPTTSAITVSPVAATVYTVSGKNTANCMSSATISIDSYSLPVLSIAPSSATVCALSPAGFVAGGATTYTWSNSGGTNTAVSFTPSASTAYTVTGTTADGCVANATVAVTTNSLPVISISPSSTTLCSLSPATFSASGAASYVWNGVTSGATFLGISANNTTYTVAGFSSQGCSTTQTAQLVTLPLPVVAVTPSYITVCNLSTGIYTVSGAATYTWADASNATTVAITPSATTLYSVSGTDANGCVGVASAIILTNPLPTVGISPASVTVCPGTPVTFTASGTNSYSWTNGSGTATTTITPTSSGVYTVTGTDQNGCQMTRTVSVSTRTVPVVSISPASASVCLNTPVSFTASGAATYVWSDNSTTPDITVIPATSSDYTVTGKNAQGCSSTATVNLHIWQLPQINISASSLSICAKELVTFTATGASGYTWYPFNVSGPTFSNTPSGTLQYNVTGVDVNGCVNSGSITVVVDKCTGIAKNALSSGMNVYPNPSSGLVTADFGFEGKKDILITSSTGAVVFEMSTHNLTEVFNLSEKAKGVYFIRITSQSASENYRIIIQ